MYSLCCPDMNWCSIWLRFSKWLYSSRESKYSYTAWCNETCGAICHNNHLCNLDWQQFFITNRNHNILKCATDLPRDQFGVSFISQRFNHLVCEEYFWRLSKEGRGHLVQVHTRHFLCAHLQLYKVSDVHLPIFASFIVFFPLKQNGTGEK